MKQASDTIRARLIQPLELSAEELSAWNRWRTVDESLQSPCFHPDFTQAVAAVRNDVELAVLEDDRGLAGFFPFQRNRLNFGRPVGGRLSDFHGVIARPDWNLSGQTLMNACGLDAWEFTHLPVNQTTMMPYSVTVEPSPYIDISNGFDAYAEERRQAGSKTTKNTQRKSRKLEREVGPIRLESHVANRAVLQTLMDWKSQQYQRTGVSDVFSFPWTVALLERLLDCQTESFSGRLSAMYAGDNLVAIHFGVETETVLHFWFPVYDTQFEKYSPGLVLLLKIVADAAQRGIHRIDLGKGDEGFKHSLKSGCIEIAAGTIERNSMLGNVRRCWRQTRGWLKESPWGAPVRASARLVRPLREWLSFR